MKHILKTIPYVVMALAVTQIVPFSRKVYQRELYRQQVVCEHAARGSDGIYGPCHFWKGARP